MNEVLVHDMAWINLENMLNKRSHKQNKTKTPHIINISLPLLLNIQNRKIYRETKSRLTIAKAGCFGYHCIKK